jgi:hypothetical protein
MPFNPDAGRSTEEIILHKWNHEWDAQLKAEITRVAHKLDCSWFEVVVACLEQQLEELEDPIAQQRRDKYLEWKETPFGIDPLLRKGGWP